MILKRSLAAGAVPGETLRRGACNAIVIGILSLGALLYGCGRNKNLYQSSSASNSGGAGAPSGLSLTPYFVVAEKTITQPNPALPMDILVSLDNSASMDENLNVIQTSLPRLFAGLKSRVGDFRLGIVKSTEDSNAMNYDSRLRGPNPVVDSTDTDASTATWHLSVQASAYIDQN